MAPRWFGRRDEPESEPTWSAPVPLHQPDILDVPLGSYELPELITVNDKETGQRIRYVSTKSEAKSVIDQLRILKKQLQLEKRAVTADLQAIRVDYRADNARRMRIRGRGDLARTIRTVDQIGRDVARRQHANRIEPLEDQKAAIDRNLQVVDSIIVELEQFRLIAQDDPKPSSKQACTVCGEPLKPRDKFCASCGEAVS